MTFTLIARCQRTGMLGIGTATNALAVGVRVPFIRRRLGAVAIMAMADERLGPLGLRLLETGYHAVGVIEQMVVADPYAEYRQFGVVDDDGHAAARTGAENKDWAGHRTGPGYVVLGNALAGEQVIAAMEESFLADPNEDLEERLMRAVEAGRDAGGQPNGQRSAALLVFIDCLKELPATLVLRPFDFDTLAVVAYQFASDERLAAAALPSLLIVVVGLAPVVFLSRVASSETKR